MKKTYLYIVFLCLGLTIGCTNKDLEKKNSILMTEKKKLSQEITQLNESNELREDKYLVLKKDKESLEQKHKDLQRNYSDVLQDLSEIKYINQEMISKIKNLEEEIVVEHNEYMELVNKDIPILNSDDIQNQEDIEGFKVIYAEPGPHINFQLEGYFVLKGSLFITDYNYTILFGYNNQLARNEFLKGNIRMHDWDYDLNRSYLNLDWDESKMREELGDSNYEALIEAEKKGDLDYSLGVTILFDRIEIVQGDGSQGHRSARVVKVLKVEE